MKSRVCLRCKAKFETDVDFRTCEACRVPCSEVGTGCRRWDLSDSKGKNGEPPKAVKAEKEKWA